MIKQLKKLLIVSNALVFLGFGPAFWFATEDLAGPIGIQLTTPTALADFRAMYGGLSFAVGVFFVMSLKRKAWEPAALFIIAATSFGLLLSRIGSMIATHGGVDPYIFLAATLELGSGVLGAILYRKG